MRGARWVQEEILEKHPEADIRVYAIWFSMLPSDSRSRWKSHVTSDRRVTHYWDSRKAAGRWFARAGGYQRVAWVLFGPEADWDDQPEPLIGYGRTIIGTRNKLRKEILPLLR